VEIMEKRKTHDINEGDVVEFDDAEGSSHYLICKSSDGYFTMNLKGIKRKKVKYYNSTKQLMQTMTNVKKIYRSSEYRFLLQEKDPDED
jgi:bifunctional DNA-binding transcriptional regulator/antitoxin component of YhaV-PrlF toxin-antitoxin module